MIQAELVKRGSRTVTESGMAQAAAEMLATGAASKFVPKLVPVINLGLAVWHIFALIKDYEGQHDEFFCTLDLGRALVEAPPSATGLSG